MLRVINWVVLKFCTPPYLLLLLIGLVFSEAKAQEDAVGIQDRPIAPVSLLGEDEAALTTLLTTHSQILLDVCGNDMEIAYARWMEMLGAMEDYSKEIDYDIRGIKIYLHVFWDPDGTLKHLSFYPKANSRNVPVDELKAFFKGFVKNYRMEIEAASGFNHYASGSFPVFDRPSLTAKKD